MGTPLANPEDVEDIWRPLTDDEKARASNLIEKASAKLRQKTPFSIEERMVLYRTDPDAPTALDPAVVADVVANIVKRAMHNPDGAASESRTEGPFTRTLTYVNRSEAAGERGIVVVTAEDIDQLRPAVPAMVASSIRLHVPAPSVLVPFGQRFDPSLNLPPIAYPDGSAAVVPGEQQPPQ